ncbi:hypothetical protein KIW84_052672 [Lathyrus oleraceus]|uniref:Uncharacterized protein n=1 Tax=Pisum sativum TaxID=3888 RepID=A0A9D4WQM6_PEA|nr:hypothetical protein KIW84_052672 [Pisum sativum]
MSPDVVTSIKGHVISNDVGSVGTFDKSGSETVSLDNPRAEKTLDQSSLNVVVNEIVDKTSHVSLSKILVANPESGVVSDVATSLAQSDHHVETTQEKSHDRSVGGEKDDSDDENMSAEGEKDLSDKGDKEESVGVKKYKSTNIVNVDDLDSDDETI